MSNEGVWRSLLMLPRTHTNFALSLTITCANLGDLLMGDSCSREVAAHSLRLFGINQR